MSGIQCKSGYPVARNLFHWDFVTRRNVAIVVNAPRANGFPTATVYNHAGRRINSEIARTPHLATRPTNDGFGRGISTGRTIENQKRIIEIDEQKIVERIDGHRGLVTYNLCLGPFENSFGRHVAVRQPVKYENGR